MRPSFDEQGLCRMIITIAFEVKNYVEVMECWPIRLENEIFFLEREDTVLKRVCLSFTGVGIEHAPNLTPSIDVKSPANLKINGDAYAVLARRRIMNWQAVVSGIQIVDLDFDGFEMRFHPESVEEEPHINLKSFKFSYDQALNSSCDFEQLGRAFCAGAVSSDRIESTSHYREGRVAFEAGRYVDAYNTMYLFLETRYCDGKTKTAQQVNLLSIQQNLCAAIEENSANFLDVGATTQEEQFNLFHAEDSIRDKIKSLVLLRGKLRHHSLKSPLRWDPNKQNEYKGAARFLMAVVHDIVIKESLESIYSPVPLEKFREISVNTGFETRIKLTTHRQENKRAIALDMSYPTTVVSSELCRNTLRSGIAACEREQQLADTVRFEAIHARNDLELFALDFDVWAYTKTRTIETADPIDSIRCSFEHFRAKLITRNEFSIPFQGNKLTILDVWKLLRRGFDHIECKDPTTRIMSLKLFLNSGTKAIVTYRVGAQVNN